MEEGTKPTAVEPSKPEDTTPTPGSDAPEKPGAEAVAKTPEEGLPKEPDKAAKAFQAMRKEIKDLKETVSGKKEEVEPKKPGAFEKLEAAAMAGAEGSDLAAQALSEARRASVQAQLAAVYQKHPTLNPDDKDYDRMFEEMVAGRYKLAVDNKEKLNVMQIADSITAALNDRAGKAKDAGKAEVTTEITEKERASLEARGVKGGEDHTSEEDYEALRRTTRTGSADEKTAAIVARMKGLGLAKKTKK